MKYIGVLLLILIILYNCCYTRQLSCILLTTCVYVNKDIHNMERDKNDAEYRKKQYIDVINLYIKHSKTPLYVVDSSGYSFPEYKGNNKINIFSYDLNVAYNGYINKSPMEAISILKAYDYFKLNRFDNIVKITGKYYIPNIDRYLNNMDKNAYYYVQSVYRKKNNKYTYQSTEIFGFKSNLIWLFYKISLLYDDDRTIQYKVRSYNKYKTITIEPYIAIVLNSTCPKKIYRFPKLPLNKKIERACNNCNRKIITYL